LQLHYELAGSGWADCTFELNGQRAKMTASYLSDALDELCRATLAVLHGESHAEAVFEEEPGEYRWILDRSEGRRLRIRIVNGVITPDNPADSVIVDGECAGSEFGEILLSELRRLLELHGEQGYLNEWIRFPFPRSRIMELQAAVQTETDV
jgi:hypothetical protein